MLASWLYVYETSCPDKALIAFDQLNDTQKIIPRFAIWIGIMLAFEQLIHASTLVTLPNRPNLTFLFKTHPRFTLPSGLALLWVIFTSLSLAMIPLTFRASTSILMKVLHVAAETTFFGILLWRFGYTLVSSGLMSLIVIVTAISLVEACADAIDLAASCGLVLDSFNFIAYFIFAASRKSDIPLWYVVAGFGWHIVYLVSFISVNFGTLTPTGLISLRISGMYANLIASEVFLYVVRREFGQTIGGKVNVQEWIRSQNQPVVVWTDAGYNVYNFTAVTDTQTLLLHQPCKTIYTGSIIWRIPQLLLTTGGILTIQHDNEKHMASKSILCIDFSYTPLTALTYDGPKYGCILSYAHIRIVYAFIAVFVGCMLALFP